MTTITSALMSPSGESLESGSGDGSGGGMGDADADVNAPLTWSIFGGINHRKQGPNTYSSYSGGISWSPSWWGLSLSMPYRDNGGRVPPFNNKIRAVGPGDPTLSFTGNLTSLFTHGGSSGATGGGGSQSQPMISSGGDQSQPSVGGGAGGARWPIVTLLASVSYPAGFADVRANSVIVPGSYQPGNGVVRYSAGLFTALVTEYGTFAVGFSHYAPTEQNDFFYKRSASWAYSAAWSYPLVPESGLHIGLNFGIYDPVRDHVFFGEPELGTNATITSTGVSVRWAVTRTTSLNGSIGRDHATDGSSGSFGSISISTAVF
jgi:hypothetical protein